MRASYFYSPENNFEKAKEVLDAKKVRKCKRHCFAAHGTIKGK